MVAVAAVVFLVQEVAVVDTMAEEAETAGVAVLGVLAAGVDPTIVELTNQILQDSILVMV